ncbi:MAG: universal stress protein [Chloroflexi bacterium]|nr:universal stress protein [Chloroflexota bacterium]
MFKHILVPIDGAEDGWRALRQAAEIARFDKGATIHGIFCIEPSDLSQPRAYLQSTGGVITSPEVSSAKALEEKYETWGRRVLQEFVNRCQMRNIRTDTHIHRGQRLRGLGHHGADADLVVLSRNDVVGKDVGFTPSRLGQACREIRRPLLLVLGYARPIERLMVCYDGGRQSKKALNLAAHAAEVWKVPLSVVSVQGRVINPEKELPKAERYLKPYNLDVDYIIRRGNVSAELSSAAEEVNADLIIIGVYRHNFLRRSLLGSTLDQLTQLTLRPVLVASSTIN